MKVTGLTPVVGLSAQGRQTMGGIAGVRRVFIHDTPATITVTYNHETDPPKMDFGVVLYSEIDEEE